MIILDREKKKRRVEKVYLYVFNMINHAAMVSWPDDARVWGFRRNMYIKATFSRVNVFRLYNMRRFEPNRPGYKIINFTFASFAA